MRRLLLLAVVLLAACGTPSAPLTTQTITDALTKAGLTISDIQVGRVDGPVPQSYTEHGDFTVAGRKGQVFICDTKKNCDAIYAYYDALKGLAGPYTYQSGGGRVVGQFNDQLDPAVAKTIETAFTALP